MRLAPSVLERRRNPFLQTPVLRGLLEGRTDDRLRNLEFGHRVLDGESCRAVAAVVDEEHSLEQRAAEKRAMRLIAGREADAHEWSPLDESQCSDTNVAEIHVELLGPSDSCAFASINQRKLELLSEPFVDATLRRTRVDECRHKLIRDRLCVNRRNSALDHRAVSMKKVRVEADFDPGRRPV